LLLTTAQAPSLSPQEFRSDSAAFSMPGQAGHLAQVCVMSYGFIFEKTISASFLLGGALYGNDLFIKSLPSAFGL
jgi:hypothetical protein